MVFRHWLDIWFPFMNDAYKFTKPCTLITLVQEVNIEFVSLFCIFHTLFYAIYAVMCVISSFTVRNLWPEYKRAEKPYIKIIGYVVTVCWIISKKFHLSSRSSVLLLAPLLAKVDPAPCRVSRPTRTAGAHGTDSLCPHFQWMADHVPVFRVPGSNIHILTSPDQFYQAMKVGVTV